MWRCLLFGLFACSAATTSPPNAQPMQVHEGAAADGPDAEITRPDGAAEGAEDAGAGGAIPANTTIDPSESCFGRCGPLPASAPEPGRCGCDVACLVRGDCCFDKHDLCAVARASALCTLASVSASPVLCGTDLGWSFEHAGALEVMFGDSADANCQPQLSNDDAQATLPLTRPDFLADIDAVAPDACDGLLRFDVLPGTRPASFAASLLFGDTSLSLSFDEGPLTGFSDGHDLYVIYRRGTTIEEPLYIAYRDPSADPSNPVPRTVYRLAETFADPHFRNVTAVTVAHFDADDAGHDDYAPGHHTLLIWGREHFGGDQARGMYLLAVPLPLRDEHGTFSFKPRYFAGVVNDRPMFVADATAAVPVLSSDFMHVMQHDVAFVPALQKWVMLYGGDVADWIDSGPRDQPRRGALHVRFADRPWGPWTAPAPAFFREQAAAFMECDAPPAPPAGQPAGCDADQLPDDPAHNYDVGPWAPAQRDFAGCLTESQPWHTPALVPGAAFPCLGSQRGNLYGANLIESWTTPLAGEHGYTHAARLFFNVSTWYPYNVILGAMEVYLP